MLESSIVCLINTSHSAHQNLTKQNKPKTKQAPPKSLLSGNNGYTVKYFIWNEIMKHHNKEQMTSPYNLFLTIRIS